MAAVWSRCLTLLSLLVARARQVQDSLTRIADKVAVAVAPAVTLQLQHLPRGPGRVILTGAR